MKLIFHHFFKAVRQQRWLLGLWLLFLASQGVLTFFMVGPDNQRALAAQGFDEFGLFQMAGGITWALVIIRLIQSEPVAGHASFWLTRPIPTWVSIPSKLLFLTGFAFLPSLALSIIDLSLFGVEPAVLHSQVTILFWFELWGMLLVVWLATYTRNLVQIWAVVALLFVLFTGFFAVLAFNTMHAGHTTSAANPDLTGTRLMLGTLGFFGGLILSLLVQYGWRRTRLAFFIGMSGIAIALISPWWPLVLPFPSIPSGLRIRPRTVPVTHLEFRVDGKRPLFWNRTLFADQRTCTIPLVRSTDAQGVPVIKFSSWSFQPPGGKSIPLSPSSESFNLNNQETLDWLPELRRLNPAITSMGSNSSQDSTELSSSFDWKQLHNLSGKAGTLTIGITGTLKTLQLCAEIPLDSHGYRRIPNLIFRLLAAENRDGKVVLKINELGYTDDFARSTFPLVFLVVDSRDQIGLMTQTTSEGSGRRISIGTWSRLSTQITIETQDSLLPAEKKAALAAQPIGNLLLQVYRIEPSADFESQVRVPNFTFSPP